MSEIERNKVEDVDAVVAVVTEAQKADRQRVVIVEDQTEGETAEHWAAELIRESKRQLRRKGWNAFGMACFHGLNVLACYVAILGDHWQMVLAGLSAANLLMVGGWMSKAKAGWDA